MGLDRRLGGPVGRHARRRGPWFDPAPWALGGTTLLWLATMLRHQPCQQQLAGHPVDAFLRLCYSDIPVAWSEDGLGTGGGVYRQAMLAQPPLTGALVALTRGIARLLGARTGPAVTAQQLVDGARTFQAVAALLLFCCLLAAVGCHLLLGSDSDPWFATRLRGRTRSRDALLVALAPVVLTAGLVSWELFTMALVSGFLLAWSLRRPLLAGLLAGLAVSAGVWPVLVLLALVMLCRRAGQLRRVAPTLGVALAVTVVVNGIAALWSPTGWWYFWSSWLHRDADLGSLWFVLHDLGLPLPSPLWLALVVAGLLLLCCGLLARLVRVAPRRPRVGQLAFLLVALWLLVDKGYTPQQVLWLVPLVVLARPVLRDLALWWAAETLYWWAVWGHLDGQLTPGGGNLHPIYDAAILLRVVVLAWLAARVVADIRRPWQDPVRRGLVDDPCGGILDHAPDARRWTP